MEEFRTIKGFENYQISNLGNVKNINTAKILKTRINNNGYYHTGLRDNGKTRDNLVHRMIAEAFIQNPLNKPCVDHIDHNKTNNHIDNLRWTSSKENNQNSSIRADNTSGFKGVSFNKNTNLWNAQIRINGIKTNLGNYDNINDAVRARLKAVLKYQGEYANQTEKDLIINLNIKNPSKRTVIINVNIEDEDA
jgi:hypothetical protein